MTPKPQANKTIPEILENLYAAGVVAGRQIPEKTGLGMVIAGEILPKEATQAITQAMLDALPKKYGLHIVKEMEELKEETKNMHPSSNAYREIERSKSISMGRKVGFNEAIDQMESAIKLIGGENK